MDNPWRRCVGMQDDAVDGGEGAELVFDFCERQSELARQIGVGRADAGLDQAVDELIVQATQGELVVHASPIETVPSIDWIGRK